jgi:hypothetical protein
MKQDAGRPVIAPGLVPPLPEKPVSNLQGVKNVIYYG